MCVCVRTRARRLSYLTERIKSTFLLERLPSERGSTNMSQPVGVRRNIQLLSLNLNVCMFSVCLRV